MRRFACVGALVVTAALAAGCSSSGPSGPSSSTPSSTPAPSTPSTSVAPSTSAPPSTPTPTPSAALSKFENDPAVKAWRAWAVEAAKTVNSGHYTSPALQKLMTASFAKTMPHILGSDVGMYYPGPVPLQPTSVTTTGQNTSVIRGCLFQQGFTWKSPTAQKPAQKKVVGPAKIYTVRLNGRWIVANLTDTSDVDCRHMEVKTQRW